MTGERVATGIMGFDDLISGGLELGSVNLITGPAGAAKSLFCSTFLHTGALAGETTLYVTLEEERDSLIAMMAAFGMEFLRLEEEGKMYLLDLSEIRLQTDVAGEKDLGLVTFQRVGELIDKHLEFSHATRVVLDSLTAISLAYTNLDALRSSMFRFCRSLRRKGITSLLITESLEGGQLTRYDIEQFSTDSFIVLGLERIQGELRRTLTVRKMRHTNHDTAIHPFVIMPRGIVVAADEKVL